MTKKKDASLSRHEALVLAWKTRKDYKGYDRSKGSAFNSWRAVVRTEKGRNIGFPATWKTYEEFRKDVGGEWSPGRVVCRIDTKAPHGSGNSFWSEKGFENASRMVVLEYQGAQKTLMEWSQELGLNYHGVRQRYFKGKDFTAHEVLFGKQKRERTPQERSAAFRTLRMLGAYRLRDKARGQHNDLTIEFMRREIAKPCTYCGDSARVGLDRVDNSKGHQQDNVVPCCYVCNCARMDNFSFEEMLLLGAVIRDIKRARNAN
jgi:hypothetical protein